MSPSLDRARSAVWCAGVVLVGLIDLFGAPTALAGRITILGEDQGHIKKGPIEVTVDGDRINLSIGGDSVAIAADSITSRVRVGHIYRTQRDADGDDVVAMGHDVVVKADEVVRGDAVSIGGSVRVDGRVEGDAVSIGGGIVLGPDAQVAGDAVSIWGKGIDLGAGSVVAGEAVVLGGRIEEAEGSRVGQRTQIGFMPALNCKESCFAAGAWILFLLHVIVIGLLGWALVKIFARRWDAALANLRARAGESLLAGLGAGILYGIVGMPLLLVLTIVMVAVVVGIPLVPLLLLLMLLVPLPGYVATGLVVGQSVRGGSLTREPLADASRRTGDFMIGHLLLSAPWFLAVLLRSAIGAWFSFAGIILLLAWGVLVLAIAFGWGAILLSRFGKRYPAGHPGVPVSVPAPPAPAAS
jgi:hypothetical protein